MKQRWKQAQNSMAGSGSRGVGWSSGGDGFNGAVDEILIYDTVLTDTEIRESAGQ